MRFLILAVFILLPIAEIAVLLEVGDIIGTAATIALIVLTAIIGVSMLRAQGLSSMQRAQNTLNEGRIPIDSVIDGVALLIAGALLLTPGLITDGFGFALLVPAFRHWLGRQMFNKAKASPHVEMNIFGSRFDSTQNPPPGRGEGQGRAGRGPIIEGEVISEDDEDNVPPSSGKPNADSPWRK